MAYIPTVNPIVTKGYAFDPICQVQMIVTQGYGPMGNLRIETIRKKSRIRKEINLKSYIEECN